MMKCGYLLPYVSTSLATRWIMVTYEFIVFSAGIPVHPCASSQELLILSCGTDRLYLDSFHATGLFDNPTS